MFLLSVNYVFKLSNLTRYRNLICLFPGESTFRCKIYLAYSVIFYIVMNIYSYYVCSERMHFIRHSEASFDDFMYSVIHFLYVVPHFYLIPCHWKEVTKVGNYFAHWSEFQVRKISLFSVGPPYMIPCILKSVCVCVCVCVCVYIYIYIYIYIYKRNIR